MSILNGFIYVSGAMAMAIIFHDHLPRRHSIISRLLFIAFWPISIWLTVIVWLARMDSTRRARENISTDDIQSTKRGIDYL